MQVNALSNHSFQWLKIWLQGMLLGAPWSLAFAPTSWWWLAIVQTLVLGLWLTQPRMASVKAAWVLGFGFGFSAYGLGVSWLYISLNDYGGLPAPLAVLSVAVFSAYLAIYPAMAAALFWWIYRWLGRSNCALPVQTLCAVLVWGMLWPLFEWLRGSVLTGFSWLNLGDAMVDSPFLQLLPWLGNHGVATVLLWVVGLFLVVVALRNWLAASLVVGLVAVGLLGVLAMLLYWPPLQVFVATQPSGTLHIAGVQPHIRQDLKFDATQLAANAEKVFFLAEEAKTHLPKQMPNSGLLVLPETVNPLIWHHSPQIWLDAFRSMAHAPDHAVLLGAAVQEGSSYYNSMVLLRGTETQAELKTPKERVDKFHLVPFGEFVPWGFAWFVRMMNIPLGDFARGPRALKPLTVAGQTLAGTVCYEDVFSAEWASRLRSAHVDFTVFVNLSNLAWFGQTWALDQHAQMGRVRSAEHAKPGIRVTNTGLSGLVDAKGQWVRLGQAGVPAIWHGHIEGRLGQTFFARWGATIWIVLWLLPLLAILAVLVVCVRQKRTQF